MPDEPLDTVDAIHAAGQAADPTPDEVQPGDPDYVEPWTAPAGRG